VKPIRRTPQTDTRAGKAPLGFTGRLAYRDLRFCAAHDVVVSNPTPSSVTSNRNDPSPSESEIVPREAAAYFATFCRASRQEK
jgi:hypothetical protein